MSLKRESAAFSVWAIQRQVWMAPALNDVVNRLLILIDPANDALKKLKVCIALVRFLLMPEREAIRGFLL